MTLPAELDAVVPSARRSSLRALVAALRPRQWTKNLLLLAGLVFAAELGDARRWQAALTLLVAYCAASSAAYLVNDLRDAPADRRHPVKRLRPVASGRLAPAHAGAAALALAAGAVVLAALEGAADLTLLALFFALQAVYTLGAKDVVLLDVAAISGLFVLRAIAGAVAVDVRISPWLLLCTALLAALLALGKRRAELVALGPRAPTRRSLGGYALPWLDRLLAATAAATVLAYAVYTVAARDSRALAATIPLVAVGVARYLVLVRRRDAGEDPENILLADAPTLAVVAAWAVACGLLLELVVER